MPKSQNSKVWMNYILLFVGIFCISWSAIFVKLANISGIGSGFYRMLIGSIGILPLWLKYKKPITDLHGVKVALICGVFFACDIALWNTSIMMSKASIATLLANLSPVWVGLGMLLIIKERPDKYFWPGTIISLIGVAIVIGFSELMHFELNLGNGLAIIASMFYGAYLITVRRGRSTLDTFSFTALSMFSSTLVLGIICWITATPIWGFEAKTWLSLAALGIVPQVIGWLTINQALGHIHPALASVSLLIQTLFTTIFAVPVLGETLTYTEFFGGAIILSGILLVNLNSFRSFKLIKS